MQPFKTLQAKRVFFFSPSLLPLKHVTFSWGGQSVQWQHLGQRWWYEDIPEGLCLSSLHMSFYKPCCELLTVIPFSRGWKKQYWIKVSFKSHHLIRVKTAYKLLSSLVWPLLSRDTALNTIFYSVHSLFTQQSIQPLDPCWLHTAVKVIQTETCSRTQIQI